MPAGGVDVRLDGRDLDFVVETPAESAAPPQSSRQPPPSSTGDVAEEGMARITLRIPESVKAKAEQSASDAGQSLNTWLVSVVRAATSDHAVRVDVDLSSVPFAGDFPFGGKPGRRRMTGWL